MSEEMAITRAIEKPIAGTIGVSMTGGLAVRDMAQAMEVAKLMSIAGQAVPAHLRANPGACLAIAIQGWEWGVNPFAIANKSYVVNDRLGYESALYHAVVLRRAPIIGRLKIAYKGDGDQRQCTVSAKVRTEESEPEMLEYQSPFIATIKPQNSPLWRTDPDQQLFYYSVRAFARRHFPDVMMGVYTVDELQDNPISVVSAAPSVDLNERLRSPNTEHPTPAAPPPADIATAAAAGASDNSGAAGSAKSPVTGAAPPNPTPLATPSPAGSSAPSTPDTPTAGQEQQESTGKKPDPWKTDPEGMKRWWAEEAGRREVTELVQCVRENRDSGRAKQRAFCEIIRAELRKRGLDDDGASMKSAPTSPVTEGMIGGPPDAKGIDPSATAPPGRPATKIDLDAPMQWTEFLDGARAAAKMQGERDGITDAAKLNAYGEKCAKAISDKFPLQQHWRGKADEQCLTAEGQAAMRQALDMMTEEGKWNWSAAKPA